MSVYIFLQTPRAPRIPKESREASVAGDIQLRSHTAAAKLPSLFQWLSLTDAECRATFPGLTQPIDDQVAKGPFVLSPSGALGPLQARIRGKQRLMEVLTAENTSMLPPELLDTRAAALHQIYRALVTAPDNSQQVPLPDTIFSMNIQDHPFGSSWTYAEPAWAAPSAGNAPIGRPFLMPHFSSWAWRPHVVGSMARAAAAIDRLESTLSWSSSSSSSFANKRRQAVWRGSVRFSSSHRPTLRQQLLVVVEQSKNGSTEEEREWADIRAVEPEAAAEASKQAEGTLMIEDFCRYRYIVYTEGITYSGRLQFHQLCRSIILTPPLAWKQHTTHLVRPLYSSDLDLRPEMREGGEREEEQGGQTRGSAPSWHPSADEEHAWPHVSMDKANLVFVAPDWSDLAATVHWLEAHPAVAEGIASRQRSLFAGSHGCRGFHSPAAEACYWRALIRGWAAVVRYNESLLLEDTGRGIPWESFALGLTESKSSGMERASYVF